MQRNDQSFYFLKDVFIVHIVHIVHINIYPATYILL